MDLTVAIPSCGRSEKLARLLDSLGTQTLAADRFEVVVGFDGTACPISNPSVRVLNLQKTGPASTRNAIIDQAKGDLLLLLNDDVVAKPDLLERHLAAHNEDRQGAGVDLILGSAPWAVPPNDSLFDRMIRETSMVFFYNTMDDTNRNRDWEFRHAWTLNLSLRTSLAREFRFDDRLTRAMFEDLEWAYRLSAQISSKVIYRSEAVVEHDHRYTPAGYLERERALGAQSLELARFNPECALEIFRSDVSSSAFAKNCAESVEAQRECCAELERTFMALPTQSPDSCADIGALYDSYRPLKKQHWHQGLLEASTASGAVVV
jgi:GT2 family glycosyltransferase